jgi:hypothetical protein
MKNNDLNVDNMDIETGDNKMDGVPNGEVWYGQYDRVNELNDRFQSRQFSDNSLEPNFSPRPVPTKYSLFPIINRRTPVNTKINPFPNYDIEQNFNPGSAAPPSGYYNNIDTETILRNQTVSLQHGAEQGVYVPSSKSDLYINTVAKSTNRDEEQPYPNLFTTPNFNTRVHPNINEANIGNDYFNNHTRTQLRNL